MDQSKMKIAYVVTQRGTNKYWTRIGVAFVNKDGSINVKLEAVPVNGEIHVRDYVPREESAGPTLLKKGDNGHADETPRGVRLTVGETKMALVEIQPSAHGRARHGTKKVASLAPHGGGRVATPAARGTAGALAQRLETKRVGAASLLQGARGARRNARARGDRRVVDRARLRCARPRRRPLGSSPRLAASGRHAVRRASRMRVRRARRPTLWTPARTPARAPSDGLTADGKVVLNRAGVDELRRIPGVGPKRAQAIVELRTKLGGRFKRLSRSPAREGHRARGR